MAAAESAVSVVGIFAKPHAPAAVKLVPELLAWLAERGVEARLDEEAARYAGTVSGFPRDLVPEGCGLAIVLGGDGTLLSAARAVGSRSVPLVAINLGGLGFLTSIAVDALYPELERALAGGHAITRRKMLRITHWRGDRGIGEYQALNDVVIAKSEIARIVDLEVWADGNFVCGYRADGLIISTPTGSTAYSLSAGGPIVYPTMNALCLTPICPHTLTNRPLIIPADMDVRVVSRTVQEGVYLTVDGQVGGPFAQGDAICCELAKFDVLLVQPPDRTFFDVLRQKLKWGER